MNKAIIRVPNIGTEDRVEIIEILVSAQEKIEEGQSVIVLESDKASMEIPSPLSGEIVEIKVKVGDKVTEGTEIMMIAQSDTQVASAAGEKTEEAGQAEEKTATNETSAAPAPPRDPAPPESLSPAKETTVPSSPAFVRRQRGKSYAGPAARKTARELGVSLEDIQGSGQGGRILKEDIKRFVQTIMARGQKASWTAPTTVDFAHFGAVEEREMSKIHRLTAAGMHASWTSIPHVTQFEEVDITNLENFRQGQKGLAAQKGIKLTPVPFLLKALALALKELPQFNVSLQGEKLVQKHYYHISMAVDTPFGLVVPVIRDVDKKSLWELAEESGETATKARNRRLSPDDMQGGCITLSSLGAQGGTQFTPIINMPEVAILGVSRSYHKPIRKEEEWIPRLMLPLALSYDHRAVNGADGAKFTTYLSYLLGDLRNFIL